MLFALDLKLSLRWQLLMARLCWKPATWSFEGGITMGSKKGLSESIGELSLLGVALPTSEPDYTFLLLLTLLSWATNPVWVTRIRSVCNLILRLGFWFCPELDLCIVDSRSVRKVQSQNFLLMPPSYLFVFLSLLYSPSSNSCCPPRNEVIFILF